jgi:transposase
MHQSDKRRKYDDAFKAEALRVARESRSTQAAARALNIRPKLLYEWQKAAQPPLPANPVEAAEVRQLRAANRRLEQELEILKKAIAIFSTPPTR